MAERAGQLEELSGAVVDDPAVDGPAATLSSDEAAPGQAAQVLGHPWLRDVDVPEQLGLGGLRSMTASYPSVGSDLASML